MKIDNFNGYFDFLNNDFPSEVLFKDIRYPSASHAFQAARASELHIRKKISLADSLEELFELAAKIENPKNWDETKLRAMEAICRDKFFRHKELK